MIRTRWDLKTNRAADPFHNYRDQICFGNIDEEENCNSQPKKPGTDQIENNQPAHIPWIAVNFYFVFLPFIIDGSSFWSHHSLR